MAVQSTRRSHDSAICIRLESERDNARPSKVDPDQGAKDHQYVIHMGGTPQTDSQMRSTVPYLARRV